MKNLLIFILLAFPIASFACSLPLTLDETILLSEEIIVAKVVSKECKWNENRNLIITEYQLKITENIYGNTNKDQMITITFAGGSLAGQVHKLCSLPQLELDVNYVLFLESLNKRLFCPIIGWEQGMFKENENSLATKNKGELVYDIHKSAFTFQGFIEHIKSKIDNAKENTLMPIEMNHNIIQTLPSKTYDPNPSQMNRSQVVPPSENKVLYPKIPLNQERFFLTEGTEKELPKAKEEVSNSRWSYDGRPYDTPIVFEPFPASFNWPDQTQMSHWNKYSTIFQVYSQPDGTYASNNGEYEMIGWVSSQDLLANYNYEWGSTTLGVCFGYEDNNGWGTEADIAFNPDYVWTSDNYASYGGSYINFNQTCLHELGHAWSLQHQFEDLSIMNYQQTQYRIYPKTHIDDVAGITICFQDDGINNNLTDVSVSLYYYHSYQQFANSYSNSSSIPIGGNFTINDVIIENLGTTNISPTIDWYLISEFLNVDASAYYLGSITYDQLSPLSGWISDRQLSVPNNIPPGQYYLAAQVAEPNDGVNVNNLTWLNDPYYVYFDPNVSTQDELENISLSMSPNPVQNQLDISISTDKSRDLTLIIHNSLGQEMYHVLLENIKEDHIQIPTDAFVSGTYFVTVKSKDSNLINSTLKFIKL